MINLELIDLYLKGFFVAVLFFKISIKLYLNFLPSFVVPYHSYMHQKWILYILLFPCQPVNGNLLDLIAFVILVCCFLKFSPVSPSFQLVIASSKEWLQHQQLITGFLACKISFKQTGGLYLGVGDICSVFFLVLWSEEGSIWYWFSFKCVEWLHLLPSSTNKQDKSGRRLLIFSWICSLDQSEG